MKNLIFILGALLALTFASCGDDEKEMMMMEEEEEQICVTCTMAGADDVEICQGTGTLAETAYSTEIAAQEALGFDCI